MSVLLPSSTLPAVQILCRVNALPNSGFVPLRQRKNTEASSRPPLSLDQIQQRRALFLRIPLPFCIARGEAPLLGARLFFAARGAAERRVEAARLERVE